MAAMAARFASTVRRDLLNDLMLSGNLITGSWQGKICSGGSFDPSPSDGRPTVCLASGGLPGSNACLSSCNYLLAAANGASRASVGLQPC